MKRTFVSVCLVIATVAFSVAGFQSSSGSLPLGSAETAPVTDATLAGAELLVDRGKAIAAGSWNQEYIADEGLIKPANADVTKEQVRAVSSLMPATYDYAEVYRTGTTLVVTGFYEGEDLGLLVVVRKATLTDPGALPTSLTPDAYILSEFIPGDSGSRAVVLDPAGNVLQSVALSAAEVPLCCALAYTAYGAYVIACEAATERAPIGPIRAAVGTGCQAGEEALDRGIDNYCEVCDPHTVTLDPKANTGTQVQGNRTQWTLSWMAAADCWSFDVFGPTVEISPGGCGFGGLVGAAAAPYAEFACCTSIPRTYDVRGTVYFVDGAVGYANGTVAVAPF